MPSDAFIKAASASNRQPVVCLTIESADAITRTVTTEQNWLDSTLVDINATREPGQICTGTDDVEASPGTYTSPTPIASGMTTPTPLQFYMSNPGGGSFWRSYTDVIYSGDRITGIKVWYHANIQYTVWSGILEGRINSGAWQQLGYDVNSGPFTEYDLSHYNLTRGTWEFRVGIDILNESQPTFPVITVDQYEVTHETQYLLTGTVTTIPFDLGEIPSIASRFETADTIPADCSIAYSAAGKDNIGDSWTSLGAVSDGGSLAPYRYYQIEAVFTSNYFDTPIITELRVIGGNSQYIYLSTHKDQPMRGALPYIVPGGISSISSKIDLTQQATIGELTAKLFWRKQLGEMIAGDVLKNKTIICKLGFVGLAEVDYEPYFVGTWYDYQSDHDKRIITVKTRNILKRFNKKIPDAAFFLTKERFHIAFGTSSVGASFSHNPDGATYVGVYRDYADTDSTDPADYTWSTINSSNGATLPVDKNSATRYLHIAFATNKTGTEGFSSTTPTNKIFVGSYIDNTLADNASPLFYNWVAINAQTNLLNIIYSKPTTAIEQTYTGNIMQVMLDIADALGIPDRLLNRSTFTTLSAGARNGANWDVSRTVKEPQDAMEMLNELSVSSGVFLFEGADGRLTAKLYDDFAAAAPIATLDAAHCKFKPVEGGQKDLSTRQAIYYNLQTGKDGGSTNDYSDCLLKINQDSEIAWEETNTREWKDKWNISDTAIQLLAARWDSWFSVPRSTVRVDDVPPRFYSIERGEVVAVNNLQLPCPADDWPGYSVGTRFLVMGKSTSDPTSGNLTVSFDLLQLEAAVLSTASSLPKYDRPAYTPHNWDSLMPTWEEWLKFG
jgi:hypothetical protein